MEDSESPTGRYSISITAFAGRMSHEIDTPTLSDRQSGEVLVSFRDTNWSLDAADWLSDSVVKLTLRKYPGAHIPAQLAVVVDCLNKIADVGSTRVSVLAQLEHELDQSLSPIPVEFGRRASSRQ